VAFDLVSTWYRTCRGLGVPVRRIEEAYRFTIVVDLLLAPVGVAAAFALPGSAAGLLLVVPPIVLLGLLQRDRRRVIDRTLLLGRAVSETNEQARTDVLTGLRNRLAWEERLAQVSADDRTAVGIVLLDVDGLKRANDVFGHEAGDRLLVAVAEIVARHRPDHDAALACRLGGDEFGLLLGGELARDAEAVAARLSHAFATAPPLDDLIPVSASVGCAIATRGGLVADGLTRADRGVYQDKARRKVRRDEFTREQE
jgi:diguanylate cyclase (GGDEF)-like protein